MPRRNPLDQVEALRRQQAEIAAKLKEAEAVERERKKQDDRRRCEIAGQVILAMIDQSPELATAFLAALNVRVKRPADRALFPALLANAVPDASATGQETPSVRGGVTRA